MAERLPGGRSDLGHSTAVETARASRGVTVEAKSSPLSRSAPIPSTWLHSLRSSPPQLLWWLRWQLYSVRPTVRATARQRRKTLRYRRTGTEDCPPRPVSYTHLTLPTKRIV